MESQGSSYRWSQLQFLQPENVQRNLTTSLYWYVQKSLDDMTDCYMHFMESTPHKLDDIRTLRETTKRIAEILDLPIDFDSTSRQLAATVILSAIQRHIKSTIACQHLLISLVSRRTEFAQILKADFLTLLEQVLLRKIKKTDYYFKDSERTPGEISEVTDLHPRVETHSYAQIFVELYLRELISPTQTLVFLDLVSKAGPSYYHTEILIYLLRRIGSSVEAKVSRGQTNLRNQGGSNSTFENIYKRLESLVAYAHTPDSMEILERLLKDRRNSKRTATPAVSVESKKVAPVRVRKYPKKEKSTSTCNAATDQKENLPEEEVTKL